MPRRRCGYLRATAKQAEAVAQLTEYEFKILKYLESMTEADWAATPPEHRKEIQLPSTTFGVAQEANVERGCFLRRERRGEARLHLACPRSFGHDRQGTEASWDLTWTGWIKDPVSDIHGVRNAMPEYLAALPIEKRRQLEGLE